MFRLRTEPRWDYNSEPKIDKYNFSGRESVQPKHKNNSTISAFDSSNVQASRRSTCCRLLFWLELDVVVGSEVRLRFVFSPKVCVQASLLNSRPSGFK